MRCVRLKGEDKGLGSRFINNILSNSLFAAGQGASQAIGSYMKDSIGERGRAKPDRTQPKDKEDESKSSRPLTQREYKEFQEKVARLKAEYGVGRVKAEVNRPPKAKNRGRPREWDHRQRFTLWLIVQTFLQDEPKIYKVFRSLTKQLPDIFENHGRLARVFYDAEAEFERYEATNVHVLRVDACPINARLLLAAR